MIRENQATRANLRIDSRESGHRRRGLRPRDPKDPAVLKTLQVVNHYRDSISLPR